VTDRAIIVLQIKRPIDTSAALYPLSFIRVEPETVAMRTGLHLAGIRRSGEAHDGGLQGTN
jgi:hypothetical protein